jgi:myo-inositol-1(or 4)-monophosphatase
MKRNELNEALGTAVRAARAAGQILRENWQKSKRVNASLQHDIKLELDVRCQHRIEAELRRVFPTVAVLGEEGTQGDPQAGYRWVVDPIDGTVNYAYQIPHACVSIALEQRTSVSQPANPTSHQALLGVVYDPFCEELWTAIRGRPARLNGQIIRVSPRGRLAECMVSVGFAKYDENLKQLLPQIQEIVPRVRKVRIMGSAALDLVYVASGRLDVYFEVGVRLWDIAAGGLILECAGGDFWHRPIAGEHYYHVVASNGRLRRALRQWYR